MEFDDIISQIDWTELDESPQNRTETDDFHQGIQEIETHLMGDDDEPAADDPQFADDFVAQFFVDFPPFADSSSGADPDDSSSSHNHGTPDSSDKDNDAALAVAGAPVQPPSPVEVDNAPKDPVLKKRQRQLRNRDAAVRSRERKKEYVKDLESKSKYLEWECRRLGRLLQCCVAENQALRFSLHNGSGAAFGATSTEQESAVLLLESLLLGSLLWFLGIICLFPLPTMAPQSWVPGEEQPAPPEGEIPRGGGSKMLSILQLGEPRGRRCKASRTRMKEDLIYSFPSCILLV
ncbi:unnamed protein product [Linum tenue]|uniref:BZIP domain-containing protein n=1 Tax=Linum tenue TaxID=586396 RepID=A0AAV0H3B4_9ROSI|nr:unnamed protein product [Linum tenue]